LKTVAYAVGTSRFVSGLRSVGMTQRKGYSLC